MPTPIRRKWIRPETSLVLSSLTFVASAENPAPKKRIDVPASIIDASGRGIGHLGIRGLDGFDRDIGGFSINADRKLSWEIARLGTEGVADHVTDIVGDEVRALDLQGV